MDSSTGFFEFIFSEHPKDFKAAYGSLVLKPYQIFDLLLSEERFTNFFSRIEIYGNNLANLLSQFPTFQKDSYSSSLLREFIRTFTASLLTERFGDTKSRSVVARIVVSVVKLSDPRALGHFGMRLGALPGILRVLIGEGHIQKLALTHKRCFEGLISEPHAREQFIGLIVDLCKDCEAHGSRPNRTTDVELAKFIRTVPCESCPKISSGCGLNQDSEGEPTGARGDSFRPNTEPNALEYLLGEPLGPWKIILSQQAMEDLEDVNDQGNFPSVQCKFYELASGDWAGKQILHGATWGNALGCRIPLFKAFYQTEHYILWQIDTAFDERFGEDYQVIKVWAIGKPPNIDRICAHIRQAQQAYTEARVGACDIIDGSRKIKYPVRVCLNGEESGLVRVDGTSHEDFGDSAQLRGQLNRFREKENRRRYMKIDSSKCTRVIDFMKFNIEYWEHLPPKLKKRIPVDLAFLEIMGVVKGSVSPATNFEPLSRQDYLGKRWRLAPNFATERERGAVYDIYEWYERAKKKRGDIDQADRIIRVMKALEAFRSSGISEDNVFEQNTRRILDEIYVDAQCISKDALFRFENAKALFYDRFRGNTSSTRDLKPTLKPLLHNFRSHKQILSIASLVMDLLYGEIFPVLNLLFILIFGVGDSITEILKFIEKTENPRGLDAQNSKFQEYGEVRVILVRDEETRDKLRKELGSSWLVLTILQSKGREFEDVFLYNFLSTTPYSDDLDILEELFKRRHHSEIVIASQVLCSELKNLYVGVTRARNRLWILENTTRDLGPVDRLFNETANRLRPDLYSPSILPVEILTEQNIGALRCFEEAKYPPGIALANAHINEEIGLTKRTPESLEVANHHFMKASELFLRAGSVAKAVQCRKEGGDLKGAAEILDLNGAYEDAAWLLPELGLFSEAGEVYAKLNKHGRALAGFESEIEPCCRKQYIHLLYLKEFGTSDTIPGKLEKRALNLIGSTKEQAIVFSRFYLMNKLFDLLSSNGKHMEAYEVGVNSGLLGNSVQLLRDKLWLKNPNLRQGTQLNLVCKFLQAERIAANPWPGTGEGEQIHPVLRTVAGRGSSQIDSFVGMWEDINRELDNFVQCRGKTGVEVGRVDDAQITGYVDILVRSFEMLVTRSIYPNNEFRLPLDHIERVLEDLRAISSDGTIPSSAKLYCGIYEIPRQPGKYTALDWSPLRDSSKPRLPLRPVDIGSLRGGILRKILRDIFPPLASLEEGLRIMWIERGEPKFVLPLTLGDWRFWRGALLEQMEFRSSCEQNLGVLFDTKSRLKTQITKYRVLCSVLSDSDTTVYRIEPAVQMGVGACVSSLLAQYQTSLFLDYRGQWMKAFRAMRTQFIDRRCPGFKYGSEMVTLVNRFVSETEAGDFPGKFCENVYEILGALERLRNSLNFYSPSVISLYEELAIALVFLVRPYEFLIPDSWHRLYFNKWERKQRSPSLLERFLYQQCLAKVCLSFCEMVINIEIRRTNELALARRSVNLIVVCLINLVASFPQPREYLELWRKSQEVFYCDGLNASGIRELPADELIEYLVKILREHGRDDSIRLVNGHQGCVDSFAGIPLKENEISVVRSRLMEEKQRHLWGMSKDKCTRQLNAAYILTVFWKLNGPRYVERMKGCRQRHAARVLSAFWRRNGPGFLERMEERRRRNAAYILTVFWKLNGPRYVDKMKGRRQRNAARILTAFWKLNGPRYVERMKGCRQRHAARVLSAFWRRNGPGFLKRMEERRRQLKAARILTAFWKLNGPKYVEKMKGRRQRNAARILTAFWRRNGPEFLKRMKERRRQLKAARNSTPFWKFNWLKVFRRR
ncbi:hypothetical protein C7212DRAFT_362777 [Tuber magnatum]|uniref:UvrD-like helicase C-terminal domain-containing protein n=1 Tax=Tuber magnatum TaxID=42249 RepID=A0A317SSV3_9PEZI|nr:hypothetical protein C7212DRAFT_362777 [Tuber magnatum]